MHPMPNDYDYRRKGSGIIGAIQAFLIVAAVVLTLCVAIAEVYILSHDAIDVYRVFAAEKWHAFGFYIGVWFSGMIAIAAVYILAEIARALRANS